MLSIFYLLVIWILFWFIGWGGWYLIPKNRRNYIKNYVIVSIYFCGVSLILIYAFRNNLENLTKNLSIFPLIILIVFFIINFLAFFLSNKYIRKPIELVEKYSTVHFLSMDYRYLLSKSFEIFFQQILVISLIVILHNQGLGIIWITIIFTFLFGFAHTPMLRIRKDIFGIIIFIASICSSFLFPFLILTFNYGFVYTYILHWMFYTNTGILFWLIKSREVREIKKIADEKIKEVTRNLLKK